MCGRYGLTAEQEAVAAAFGVTTLLVDHVPRYNIAPTQDAPVVVRGGTERRLVPQRWGLIPPDETDLRRGARLINARSETVSTRPTFRDAWRKGQRCVVPATGFFEWSRPEGGWGARIPYWIHMEDERPFGLAGIWDCSGPPSDPIQSFAILTAEPNDLVSPIHDRMPVILGDAAAWEAWMDPQAPWWQIKRLFAPRRSDDLEARRVSTFVNNPRNEGPECIEPTGLRAARRRTALRLPPLPR